MKKSSTAVNMCDIGIGQAAPRYPVKIIPGVAQDICGETYKFEKDDNLGWVLSDLCDGKWRPFISFTEEKQFENDFIQPSFYCEMHPDSKFNKLPIIALKTPEGRKTVNGREFKRFSGEELVYLEENISDERFCQILSDEFNIKYSI